TPAVRTIWTVVENGSVTSETILDGSRPAPNFWQMLRTGATHILTGADHVLFILGLALLKGEWKSKLKLLTAFTVAHSVSLALTVLNWV
ncbi:HupE/UreJ family protein, partial [Acinetobacter baumannii]